MTFKHFLYLNARSLLKLVHDERWTDLEIKYRISKTRTKYNINYNSITKEQCIEIARRYKSKSKLSRCHNWMLIIAKKNGWYEECISHIVDTRRTWTFDDIMTEAIKYNTRIEWKNNHGASYGMASKFGRERFTGHMTRPVKECGYWTKERVAEDAKKYQTRSAWGKKSKAAYSIAQKAGWLEEMCSHMYYIKKQSVIKTREQCLEIARTCKTIPEWKKKNHASLIYATRHNWYNGILDELGFKKKVCKIYASTEEQATKLRLTRNSCVNVILLTKQMCIDSARKFKTKIEWYNAEYGIYMFSKKMGWFDEITAHHVIKNGQKKKNNT